MAGQYIQFIFLSWYEIIFVQWYGISVVFSCVKGCIRVKVIGVFIHVHICSVPIFVYLCNICRCTCTWPMKWFLLWWDEWQEDVFYHSVTADSCTKPCTVVGCSYARLLFGFWTQVFLFVFKIWALLHCASDCFHPYHIPSIHIYGNL